MMKREYAVVSAASGQDQSSQQLFCLEEPQVKRLKEEQLADEDENTSSYGSQCKYCGNVRSFTFQSRQFCGETQLELDLLEACRQGHLFLLQQCVQKKANVNIRDVNGFTPLLICAEKGFAHMTRYLLERGADIRACDIQGNNALILSIRPSGSSHLIELLINYQINVNHQNMKGETALMKAIEVRDIAAIECLVDELRNRSDGSVEHLLHITSTGETIWSIAKRNGLGKLLSFLTEENPDIKNVLLRVALTLDVELTNMLLDCSHKLDSCRQTLLQEFLQALDGRAELNDKHFLVMKAMLERGIDVNGKNEGDIDVPIVTAVKATSYETVELFCQHNATLDVKCRKSKHLLLIAAEKDREDLVELIYSYSNSCHNSHPVFTGSALDVALRQGLTRCAEILLKYGAYLDLEAALQTTVHMQIPSSLTFLCEYVRKKNVCKKRKLPYESCSQLLIPVVRMGHLDMISLMIDSGVDVNLTPDNQLTVLMEAKTADVARLLIQLGADVNKSVELASGKTTALFHVLYKQCKKKRKENQQDILEVLVMNGANINLSNDEGHTPLMMAADAGCHELVKLLLKYGADPLARDTEMKTALFHAIEAKSSRAAVPLIQTTRISEEGLNVQTNDGSTPLIAAAKEKRVSLVRLLIKKGADVNIADKNGDTVLQVAVGKCLPSILRDIVKAGADINCQNKAGETALMIAAQENSRYALEILLDLNADVHITTHKGNHVTALFLVCKGTSWLHYTYLEMLLLRHATSSYLQPEIIHRTIVDDKIRLIHPLISNGLAPKDIEITDKNACYFWNFRSVLKEVGSASPLTIALLKGNSELAHYLEQNNLFTKWDMTKMIKNETIRLFLEQNQYKHCLQFLDAHFAQPMSLVRLALIAVSSAVGFEPGREKRVGMLPVPQLIKDKLLLKTVS